MGSGVPRREMELVVPGAKVGLVPRTELGGRVPRSPQSVISVCAWVCEHVCGRAHMRKEPQADQREWCPELTWGCRMCFFQAPVEDLTSLGRRAEQSGHSRGGQISPRPPAALLLRPERKNKTNCFQGTSWCPEPSARTLTKMSSTQLDS